MWVCFLFLVDEFDGGLDDGFFCFFDFLHLLVQVVSEIGSILFGVDVDLPVFVEGFHFFRAFTAISWHFMMRTGMISASSFSSLEAEK